MDTMEQLLAIAKRIEQNRDQIETEEATKTAVIMPFINGVLGYNVFDINEVVPEFVADVGLKKGEKVDYVIKRDGEVTILIECKKLNQPLNVSNASQLFRYFHVTKARIAILTNGQHWLFFTDLDQPNKMDEKPFMVLDLLAIDPTLVPQITKHSKAHFDIDSVLNAAEELKYVSAVKRVLARQLSEVDADFAQFFLAQIYTGRISPKIREQLTPLIHNGIRQFITDQVNERLKKALGGSDAESQAAIALPVESQAADASTVNSEPDTDEIDSSNVVQTTVDEVQGHFIIRALVGELTDIHRITMRDVKSYCSILFDDNNRKPIARLWFNAKQWHLGLFDAEKNETKFPITGVEGIYQHKEAIQETVRRYL